MEIVNGTWEVAVANEIVETMNNGKPGIGIRAARIPRLKNAVVMHYSLHILTGLISWAHAKASEHNGKRTNRKSLLFLKLCLENCQDRARRKYPWP